MVASVPGWLQSRPYEYRRFGFEVVTDEPLRHAAEQIAAWRKAKHLREAVYFNTNPDVIHYFAWFGDDIRGFLDQRLDLYGESDGAAAHDYKTVREGIGDSSAPEGPGKGSWRKVFLERKMRLLVYHSTNLSAGSSERRQLLQMLSTREVWGDPLFQEGGTVVFVWKDPQDPNPRPYPALRVDVQQLAFGPKAEPAPAKRTDRATEPPAWYTGLFHAEPRRSVAADDAQYHYLHYVGQVQNIRRAIARDFVNRDAASVVTMAAHPEPLGMVVLAVKARSADPRLWRLDGLRVGDGSPATPSSTSPCGRPAGRWPATPTTPVPTCSWGRSITTCLPSGPKGSTSLTSICSSAFAAPRRPTTCARRSTSTTT